jgi:hypothetical protein
MKERGYGRRKNSTHINNKNYKKVHALRMLVGLYLKWVDIYFNCGKLISVLESVIN